MANNKEKTLSVRVAKSEYDLIAKYCQKTNMKISDFIRFSALVAIEERYIPQKELMKFCYQLISNREMKKNQRIMSLVGEMINKWT